MRISDWSSDVCSSDLPFLDRDRRHTPAASADARSRGPCRGAMRGSRLPDQPRNRLAVPRDDHLFALLHPVEQRPQGILGLESRSEEHTSELQSLMHISYAVFGFKKNRKAPV